MEPSLFTFVVHQISLNATEALRSDYLLDKNVVIMVSIFKNIMLLLGYSSANIRLMIANVNIKKIYSAELLPIIRILALKEPLTLFQEGHDTYFYI